MKNFSSKYVSLGQIYYLKCHKNTIKEIDGADKKYGNNFDKIHCNILYVFVIIITNSKEAGFSKFVFANFLSTSLSFCCRIRKF